MSAAPGESTAESDEVSRKADDRSLSDRTTMTRSWSLGARYMCSWALFFIASSVLLKRRILGGLGLGKGTNVLAPRGDRQGTSGRVGAR